MNGVLASGVNRYSLHVHLDLPESPLRKAADDSRDLSSLPIACEGRNYYWSRKEVSVVRCHREKKHIESP